VLSDHQAPALRRACFVGRGVTLEYPLAVALQGAGWLVNLLTADAVARQTPPPGAGVREFHADGPAEASDRVRHALVALHRDKQFRFIAFAGAGGLGFRAIQAKRAELAFADVPLAVVLDANSQRDREAGQRWPASFGEVETDYLERWSFENADVQVVPDDELLAFIRRNHWSVRPDASKELPAEPLTRVPQGDGGTPLVTLAIAHYNLGPYFPDTLATLAAQTYPNLEVIAIDDGSTDPASRAAFDAMEARYPRWKFLRQANAGIGTTRNRILELATGEFFIPVDADNLAKPDMVEKFVRGIQRNPDLAAMSCYLLAFDVPAADLVPKEFLYALRPTGGPHALAVIRNVYGDANAIFRTETLRAVGGYGTDRGTSCEDWELFVKLVHAGHRLGVVPDHLFYYRHRPGGFSRSTNWFANHQRVLRQFAHPGILPPAEALQAWTALLGFHQELQHRDQAPRRAGTGWRTGCTQRSGDSAGRSPTSAPTATAWRQRAAIRLAGAGPARLRARQSAGRVRA
jgi:GT2 family glycosyltransferase